MLKTLGAHPAVGTIPHVTSLRHSHCMRNAHLSPQDAIAWWTTLSLRARARAACPTTSPRARPAINHAARPSKFQTRVRQGYTFPMQNHASTAIVLHLYFSRNHGLARYPPNMPFRTLSFLFLEGPHREAAFALQGGVESQLYYLLSRWTGPLAPQPASTLT